MPDLAVAAVALSKMARTLGLTRFSINEETRDYQDILERLVVDAANGNARRSAFVKEMQQEIIDRAETVYIEGLREAGREPPEITDDDQKRINDWILSQTSSVGAFVDDAMAVAELTGDERTEARNAMLDRVGVWVQALDWLGGIAKLEELGNIYLTFDGDDGKESCVQCQVYKGQRHKRSWWESRGLLERNGNLNFDCGRWENCQHNYYDDDGEMIL